MQQKEPLQLPARYEQVELGKPLGKRTRRFLAFLVCCGLLTAAFAVSGAWKNAPASSFPLLWESFWSRGEERDEAPTPQKPSVPPIEETPSEELQIPQGAYSIKAQDLSGSRSPAQLCNETAYRPDAAALTFVPTEVDLIAGEPLVLILHTHATEGYLEDDQYYLEGTLGDVIYTEDRAQSVVAVGDALCRSLNQNGIPAVQCQAQHGEDGSLRGSYAGAAACIKRYLALYPSIRYVIDLHRDSILTSAGEYIKALAPNTEQPTAQIQMVVGSDGNGTPCPQWKENLALALSLQRELEQESVGLCRPIYLKNASYNQELAPFSLLLEIGTGGNTLPEAMRAAELTGRALARLLLTEN